MNDLLAPFAYDFFTRGVIVATLSGALLGLIGVYITLKGMSYIGHGLSHAIYGGFAASTIVSFNFYVGAGLWGLGSAMAINAVSRRRAIGADAAIGVITTASFALGVALLRRFGSRGASFDAALFGSILGLTDTDVLAVAAVTVLAVLLVFFRYRALLFTTFDPEVADVSGVSVARTDALLTATLALGILVTLNVIGVTLVAAILVTPPVVARMLTVSFSRMLVISTVVGALCGFVGMNLSYHYDVPSGTMIVLTGAAVFVLTFALTGVRGLRRTAGLAH
ncbi:MAG TPA: metal ABC transporter permease [Frankiaceae bacterium]|nr:metal ABC transporter permease [Frankiaceae bacterium]